LKDLLERFLADADWTTACSFQQRRNRQLGQASLCQPVLLDMAVWRDWGSFEVRVVAIIGARHPKQLTDTTPATDVELSDETLREIEMIMKDAVPTGGPSPEAM